MNNLSQSVMALIEYHNQPTAFGWFRNVDRPGFYLQQLPLSDVDFALLMSDFFVTFGVCARHYDEERYFPAPQPQRSGLTGWLARHIAQPYSRLTPAMLCDAARLGRWPEEAD